jgi:hypothetical protein
MEADHYTFLSSALEIPTALFNESLQLPSHAQADNIKLTYRNLVLACIESSIAVSMSV